MNELITVLREIRDELRKMNEPKSKPSEPRPKFKPPTRREVDDYCRLRQNYVDADEFMDFYQSKGWLVGNQKMKDWKAAVRTWERERSLPGMAPSEPEQEYERI